jgi:hypothetical protein
MVMTDVAPHELRLLAKVVVILGVALMIAGIAWRGISVENMERIARSILTRASGPLAFRFILQPVMAAVLAIRDGLHDAKRGRSPFFWTILSNPDERWARLRDGLNATAKILLLGLLMDTIYQILVFRTFYPYEALIISVLLAFVPYLLIRGLVSRGTGKLGRARVDLRRPK